MADAANTANPLLDVQDLHVEFDTFGGVVEAVRGVSFSVAAGRTLAVVGESGCGKSVTAQSLLRLIPMPPGRVTQGTARFDGQDLLTMPEAGLRTLRGREIAVIFQDPMSALNPTMRLGEQIAEMLRVHEGLTKQSAFKRAVELLDETRIPEPATRARQYPFQFSGGMLQRAMIAMALACKPRLLIADEPTTALDVTIQAQILDLLEALQKEHGMAMLLITHDLGVVARLADEVAVMYAGQIVEHAPADQLYADPQHPYTQGLKNAMPRPDSAARLEPIEGSPPDLFAPPPGCAYCDRCPQAMQICKQQPAPILQRIATGAAEETGAGPGWTRCWLHHPDNRGHAQP